MNTWAILWVWQLSSHFYYKNLAQIFPTKLSKLGAIPGGIIHPLSGFVVGKFWWWPCAVTNMTVTVIRKESPAVTHNQRSKPQLSLSFTLTVFLIQHFPSLGLRIEPTASHGWNEDQSIVIAPGTQVPWNNTGLHLYAHRHQRRQDSRHSWTFMCSSVLQGREVGGGWIELG